MQIRQRDRTLGHAVSYCFLLFAKAYVRSEVKIFDLLHLNGMSLARKSVKFRKRNLRACVKEIKGRLEFITEFEGRTADDVRKRLEEVMDARGEGLIIKHPNSEYVLNGRNKDWVKVQSGFLWLLATFADRNY